MGRISQEPTNQTSLDVGNLAQMPLLSFFILANTSVVILPYILQEYLIFIVNIIYYCIPFISSYQALLAIIAIISIYSPCCIYSQHVSPFFHSIEISFSSKFHMVSEHRERVGERVGKKKEKELRFKHIGPREVMRGGT